MCAKLLNISINYMVCRPAQGHSVGVYPTRAVTSVPVVRAGTYLDKPCYGTVVQRQSEAACPKDSINFVSRPVERPGNFEKGTLLDLYA